MKKWWGGLVVLALVLLGASLAQTGTGHALLQDTGLYEAPPSFTELAFTAPANLPAQLKSAHAPIGVSFSIHNVSGASRTYDWSIALVRSSQSHVKASGVATVPPQGRATVAKTVAMSCVGGRLQIVVRLASPAESIDFWVTCPLQTRSVQLSQDSRPVVALVSDAIYPYFRGGKEQRYHEVARRLARNAEVHMYTMKWWDGPSTHRDGQVTFHAVSRLYDMYIGERRSFREAIFFAVGCLRLLGSRFDVIEVDQFPYFHILILRLVTWLKRKRLTVTWHEVWGRAYWHEYVGRAGSAAWLIEWLAMRAPDHIIAASAQTAARLHEILGDRASISVVPNGIDLDGIRNSYPDAAQIDLVTVGRMLPHKNFDMLLDAVALLHAKGLSVTCRVIGDGPQCAALHEHARDLGIEHAVDFRHDIWEQKELYSLMKAAKVAVFPTAREGFGIAVLEAIACGIPVVTTSAPDNLAQHLVARSEVGLVCDPSAEAIAAAVQRLLERTDGRSTKESGQDAWLTEHSWDTAADRIAGVLGI